MTKEGIRGTKLSQIDSEASAKQGVSEEPVCGQSGRLSVLDSSGKVLTGTVDRSGKLVKRPSVRDEGVKRKQLAKRASALKDVAVKERKSVRKNQLSASVPDEEASRVPQIKPSLSSRFSYARRSRHAYYGNEDAAGRSKGSDDSFLQDRKYVASLDGLRAVAVIAVILYHLGFGWAKGGLLGVTVFFVLSGYLITGILTNELSRTGGINLKRFWLRRVKRLFPAIVVVVVLTTLLCVLFDHKLLSKLRPDVLPSLFWMQNWWYILRDLSYFDALGEPSPLVHFWSLAIEEQFYLVWPLLLLLAYKIGASKKQVRVGCLVLAAASAIWMFVLFDPEADPTRVYYGTDTRAFSLLIGAWLSFVWPWKRFDDLRSCPRYSTQVKIEGAAFASLAVLIGLMIFVEGTSPAMYKGVILLASVLTGIILVDIVLPGSFLAKVFSLKPFSWIGMRSYGMYLWHFPLILLLKVPLRNHMLLYTLAVFALTFVLAGLQYRFIENPIRHEGLGWFKRQLAACRASWKRATPTFAAITLVFGGAVVGCAVVPDEEYVPEEAIQSTGDDAAEAKDVAQEFVDSDEAYDPILIGDSVPGMLVDFGKDFPRGLNDSYVGRWAYQASEVLQGYVDQGVVGKVVVVECFSNHAIEEKDLDALYACLKEGQDLFLVTPYTPDNAVTPPNTELIYAFADKHENVHVIDWAQACAGYEASYLYDDYIHLTPDGAAAYQALIKESISDYLPDSAFEPWPGSESAESSEAQGESADGGESADNAEAGA